MGTVKDKMENSESELENWNDNEKHTLFHFVTIFVFRTQT